MREPSPVSLEGAVERVTFTNPESGFSVIQMRVRGHARPVPVVGTLPAVQPGEVLALTGQWRTDPRHGAQFQAATATVSQPTDAAGIVRYLGSGLIRQIGPVLAKRIVGTFGDRTLEVLDAAPDRVREVPGIGAQRAAAIARAWAEHRSLRGVISFLVENELDPRFAPRLLRLFGTEAPRILAANPYRLVAEAPGLGFAEADRLGQAIGVRPSSPARLQAAVHAVLLRAAEDGHTRVSRDQLLQAAAALSGQPKALLEGAVMQVLAAGAIAVRSKRDIASAAPGERLPEGGLERGRVRLYEPMLSPADDDSPGLGLSRLVVMEEDLAARALGLARRGGIAPDLLDRALAADEDLAVLSMQQRDAVRQAAGSGLFVLTGGPGVGKTTTTRALVRLLLALHRSVALAAPTGKAARRLGEVAGLEARTLHRLLGSDPRGFRHGPRDPLPFDTVIVDECSMLDTTLARALFRAMRPGSQLILVGDADQLPSVGPGQVLRDLLQAGAVPSMSLTTVFRQAARSAIVTNAHRIRVGALPELFPSSGLAEGLDFAFVAAPPAAVAEIGAEWAAHLLPGILGLPASGVQVLAPLTRVCQAVNSTLQQVLNPPSAAKRSWPHGALALRARDRVIQIRNNYDLDVFNGDTGVLTALSADEALVDFGEGRLVRYDAEAALDLDHAYCLTVHRAQGSEWPGVVMLASSAYGGMLTRNLLYTAVTRARRAVVVVGDQQAITRAVAETRDQNRGTGLAALLEARDG